MKRLTSTTWKIRPDRKAFSASCRCGGSQRATKGTIADNRPSPYSPRSPSTIPAYSETSASSPDSAPCSTCIAAATVAASSSMKVPMMMAQAWNSGEWPASASSEAIEPASIRNSDPAIKYLAHIGAARHRYPSPVRDVTIRQEQLLVSILGAEKKEQGGEPHERRLDG